MVTKVGEETKTATKTYPFIREIPWIGSINAFTKDRLSLFEQIAELGDVAAFTLFGAKLVMINHPNYIHELLVERTHDYYKGALMHKAFAPAVGDSLGLFINEGESHRRQRKLMAPAFQPRYIANYADIMTTYADQIICEWHDGQEVAIDREMTRVTMGIIGKALFDQNVFTESDELGEAMSTVFSYITYLLSHPFYPPRTWPTPRNMKAERAGNLLRQRLQRMIDDRRREGNNGRFDFLSLLLQARYDDGSAMSDSQLMEESLTLFGAGHETTALTMTWTWYLLSQNPEVYQKLQQEVDTVLQGRLPTYQDLAKLPYCLQVFKEAMRIYPPAYAFGREALNDTKIGEYHIPKGTIVMACPYIIHRRADLFPDPLKFEPERFTPEREKQLVRYAYFPFGAGPRICIGNHFALMEGQMLIAAMAQRVKFELLPGQNIQPDPNTNLTMRPNKSVKMKIHFRNPGQ